MSERARLKRLYEERERITAELRAVEDGTLPFIEEAGEVTPADVAEAFGISVQAANNRLVRLARVALLDRERTSVNGGGKAFIYRKYRGPVVAAELSEQPRPEKQSEAA
jgi:predicted ArsR family transcriptional regulator